MKNITTDTHDIRATERRMEAEQVTPEPPKKIITPTPGPGHPLAAIYDMIKARNKVGEGSE